jgi:hypothetical protein
MFQPKTAEKNEHTFYVQHIFSASLTTVQIIKGTGLYAVIS